MSREKRVADGRRQRGASKEALPAEAQVTSPACSGYAPGGSPQARPPQSEPSAGRYGGRGVVRFAV